MDRIRTPASLLLAFLLSLAAAPALAQAPRAPSTPAANMVPPYGLPFMPGVNSLYGTGWQHYYYRPGFGYAAYPPMAAFRPENVYWYYPQGPANPPPVSPATIGVSPSAIGVRPFGR